MDATDLEDKLETIKAHTVRYAKDAAAELATITKRIDIITEDMPDGRRARGFMLTEALAMPYLTDDELLRRWHHEKRASIICDPATTFSEKCALLEIDEDDVLEKAGIICENRSTAGDALALYLVATSQIRKGGTE